MKNIEIFLDANYDTKFNMANVAYYLVYGNAIIKRCDCIQNAGSHHRALLKTLSFALKKVTEPCNILVHSRCDLGFKNAKKSVNKDMILSITKYITSCGHVIAFDTEDDYSRVRMWEQLYGNKSSKQKSVAPNIKGKKSANDVFDTSNNQSEAESDWRLMYSDLMGPSQCAWVPGSGGY